MRPKIAIWLILVITLFASLVNSPQLKILSGISGRFPVKLGLDLQGGTEILLQTQMQGIAAQERDQALEAARGVIERRVNFYGVSEAVVQSSRIGQERRILVQLPGIKDTKTAIDLVGKTAQLEFREFIASSSAEATVSGQVNLKAVTQSTGLTGADLKKAQVTFGSSRSGNSGPEVSLEFTAGGAQKFAEITQRNIGKPLAIFLDDQPLMWPPPIVQQEIIGGNAVINGRFSAVEAKNIAIQLNAGALPVPIKVLNQRSVGATLGNESVNKSLVAAAIGILTVMFFMASYYGVFGLLADLALLIYILLSLAVFRTGLFILPQVTLTLAGIAGFVLSVGMAVDANVLTFERVKEELRSGKRPAEALNIGFTRSWTSIRDSNISSLISAMILYIFGTSVVRGFALTLAIGVLVSMFSAIFITRTFLRLLPRFK